jgi:diguanylate cyclase (GGDEF)-like protein
MTPPLLAVPDAAPCEVRRLVLVDGDVARADAFTFCVADGATAVVRIDDANIDRILQIAPDLVIGSHDAIAEDDFRCVRALARLDDAAPVPVLVLVDDASRRDLVRVLHAGAADCIVWPSEPGELLARIDTHVRQARRTRSLWVSSYRDPLTGLFNRRGLLDALRREIERATRRQESLALLFIDLDGLKRVNDCHGHDVGDLLIKRAAELLSDEVRAGDVVARLGGDEFVIVLHRDAAGAQSLAARLEARLADELPYGALGASVGIAALAHARDHVGGAEELLRSADRAMYARKRVRCARVAEAKG